MDWVEKAFDDAEFSRDFELVKHETEMTAREAAFIRDQLNLQPSDRVLDLCCGFGRHALLLAGSVAEIVGVDRTKSYIGDAQKSVAEQELTNASFVLQDMRRIDFDCEFDAAYNYFTAWGYYDDETNFDVLKRIRRALRPGGLFLLETVHRDGELRSLRPNSWIRRRDGVLVLYERRMDFVTGRYYLKHTFVENGNVRELEIDHYLPTSDQLIRLLLQAEFSSARIVSAPDGGKVGLKTRRLAAIAAA